MRTTTTGVISAEEVVEAVRLWLELRKGVRATDIRFTIEGKNDPDDWRAEYGLTYELVAATFTVKPPGNSSGPDGRDSDPTEPK